MPSLLIKDLPELLHRSLKESAESHRRSMTKEALFLIETGLQQRPRIRQMPRPYRLKRVLTKEWIDKAKREGRS